MSQAEKRALKKMGESDLNKDIWGHLFRTIIEKTEGGTKEGTVRITPPLSNHGPHELMAFIGIYLDIIFDEYSKHLKIEMGFVKNDRNRPCYNLTYYP